MDWFKWPCWLVLALLVVFERFWDKLPWDVWQSRMLYPGLALALVILLFTRFTCTRRGFFALIAVMLLCLQFEWSGTANDVGALRKSTVMVWVYTIALALIHDESVLRKSPRRQANSDSGDESAPRTRRNSRRLQETGIVLPSPL